MTTVRDERRRILDVLAVAQPPDGVPFEVVDAGAGFVVRVVLDQQRRSVRSPVGDVRFRTGFADVEATRVAPVRIGDVDVSIVEVVGFVGHVGDSFPVGTVHRVPRRLVVGGQLLGLAGVGSVAIQVHLLFLVAPVQQVATVRGDIDNHALAVGFDERFVVAVGRQRVDVVLFVTVVVAVEVDPLAVRVPADVPAGALRNVTVAQLV